MTDQARRLRANPTEAEKVLWALLRPLRHSHGLHFRRQMPLGKYVVDFACASKAVIVEIDGGQHTESADAERDAWLDEQGFRVLRFWNNELFENPDGVMETIYRACGAPHPKSLPASGEGLSAGSPSSPLPARGEGFRVGPLQATDLERLGIPPSRIATAIEHLFAERAAGRAWSTPKSMILPPDGRLLMTMMAASEDPPLMAVKSLVMNAANPDQGLPQINAQVTLTDAISGTPLATLDGNWVTEVRTAALSLIAARRMARPDATSLALVGTGVQGRAHLTAFAEEFPLERVFLVGRGRTNLDRLAALALDLGIEPIECEAEDALRAADMTVTSISYTKTTEPFLDAAWIKPGSFTAVTDTFVPWRRETLDAFDRRVIDDLEQERAMTARRLLPLDEIDGDLSGLLDGTITGRLQKDDRTLFAFRGHGLADLAAASLAYTEQRAQM